MQSLSLKDSDIGDGAKALADLLQKDPPLKDLTLNGNKISNPGAMALGKALKINSILKELNLRSNQIGNEGATCIFSGPNRRLISIDLGPNQIGDKGVEVLGQSIGKNSTLKKLNLSSNYFSNVCLIVKNSSHKCLLPGLDDNKLDELSLQQLSLRLIRVSRRKSVSKYHKSRDLKNYNLHYGFFDLQLQRAMRCAMPQSITEIVLIIADYVTPKELVCNKSITKLMMRASLNNRLPLHPMKDFINDHKLAKDHQGNNACDYAVGYRQQQNINILRNAGIQPLLSV